MERENDRQLTGPMVAAKLGIKPSTWRSYRKKIKGLPAPPPDGWHDKRTPWWWESTIDKWNRQRAGAGARTDLVPNAAPEQTPTG